MSYYASSFLSLSKFGDESIFEVRAQGTTTILYSIFSALSIDVGFL